MDIQEIYTEYFFAKWELWNSKIKIKL